MTMYGRAGQTPSSSLYQARPNCGLPTNSMAYVDRRNATDKTTGGSRKSNLLDATSLLAQNFVPHQLRAINSVPISAIIPTKPPPSLERQTQQVFYGLLGRGHYDATRPDAVSKTFCYCSCPGQTCQYHPQPTMTSNEKSFVEHEVERRKSTSIPMIDAASRPSEYAAIFRQLLQVEYDMIRLLYERYEQFDAKIETPKTTKMDRREGRTGFSTGAAYLRIAGLADGRPPLQPGDLVFVRPHYDVRLQCNEEFSPIHHPNPNVYFGRVEIHSRVLSIVRARQRKSKKPALDSVLISWVVDPIFGAHLKRHPCTVRFVPASKFHERCLTALEWFMSSVSPQVSRDLLFPSKPPNLPSPPVLDENETDNDSFGEFEYEQLNKNQTRFVEMVLTRTASPSTEGVRPPMILTGPAGTGKTKTILAAILQIIRRQTREEKVVIPPLGPLGNGPGSRQIPRILICTPSHTACDVITRRLAKLLARNERPSDEIREYKQDSEGTGPRDLLFRLYDVTRGIESVPIDVLPYTRQDQDGQFVIPNTEEFLSFAIIVCTCEDAHILFLAGLTNASLRKRRRCIQANVEETLRASGLKLSGEILGSNQTHFTHLFIDEAAQATEPESLIPLSVVVDDHWGATKVEIALCGDPRQLSPNIYSPVAFDGLQRSLLERLLRLPVETYGGGRDHMLGPPTSDSWKTMDELIEYSFQKDECQDHLSVFLNLCYRGHPCFLLMPSKLFYFDKLKSAVSVGVKSLSGDVRYGIDQIDDNHFWVNAVRCIETLSSAKLTNSCETVVSKPMGWPMHFRGVIGKDKSVAIESFFGSNSWCNHEEASVILEMVETLVATQVGVGTQSIGIIAAFRAQVVLIRRLLREKHLGAVNVGLPEDFQAVECDVIIVSLTRSTVSLMKADAERRAGLFHQPKRMNVALTRAEHLLIVVGNPTIMKEDKAWQDWLEFCAKHGLWYGETCRGVANKFF